MDSPTQEGFEAAFLTVLLAFLPICGRIHSGQLTGKAGCTDAHRPPESRAFLSENSLWHSGRETFTAPPHSPGEGLEVIK